MPLKGEMPLSMKQISLLPEVKERVKYGTLRVYVQRYKDKGFPEAVLKNVSGAGMAWYASEIIFFLKNKPDTRGSTNHKDSSARATKGHKNRKIRQGAPCYICLKKIEYGEIQVEYIPPNSTEIEVYHDKCANLKGI